MSSNKKDTSLVTDVYESRKLIATLAKNDFKRKFAGSYLGVIWAFVQPLVTVLVYWFVMGKVMNNNLISVRQGLEVPFILYLVAGLVPWFFFQDALNGGTNALIDYKYLVQKVVFKIDVLPIVKIISALFVHIFLLVFTVFFFGCYKFYPDLYTLQIIYYSFALIVFVLGLSYMTSAVVVFFRDLTQFINIVLQVGVWMTPIMWTIETFGDSWVAKVLKLNPLYYIVSGYRDAFYNKVWFFERPGMTFYYWAVTIIIFVLGTVVFKRLKVHFADVL